ncbi:MAG: fructosamine kinase family protein, partial [Proteobacteria bacterium]|nr:fructosamine kinase family protein [Pseudomonadota bacterium]
GLKLDTVFGSAHQPNGRCSSWIGFFRDRRLLYMAGLAFRAGRMDDAMLGRVKELAGKLEDLIEEPAAPSLLHGDLWQGNMLVRGGRIEAFIDPAIYYGHAEMDLAFSTLFGTLSDSFFGAYQEQRPIAAGFFEQRRDLYNLWPLLGHVLFFGGAYLGQVDAILRRHNI